MLNHYYTPNIPVRSPDGVVIGNQAVIHATWATPAAAAVAHGCRGQNCSFDGERMVDDQILISVH